MFKVNTQYRHDRKLCSIRFLCCSFFSHVVVPFLPDWRHNVFFSTVHNTFLFPTVHKTRLCSTVPFQTKPPHLPIHGGWQKGSHLFYSRDFWLTTSHYPFFLWPEPLNDLFSHGCRHLQSGRDLSGWVELLLSILWDHILHSTLLLKYLASNVLMQWLFSAWIFSLLSVL